MLKKFLVPKIAIPLAAFALTVTSASAFVGVDMLDKLNINLTDSQKSALEQAHTIRDEANTKAKQVLTAAGIDEAKMDQIRTAMHSARAAEHKEVSAALDAKDYSAFKTAVQDSPLADKITTEEQFNQLVKAHTLMQAGDQTGAKTIMDTLGLAPRGHADGDEDRGGMMGGRGMMNRMTTAQ